MRNEFSESRRHFLRVSSAAGGGLLISFCLPTLSASNPRDTPPPTPLDWRPEASTPQSLFTNGWIRIDRNNEVTLRVASAEMGQGVMTAIPMLIAEELEVDLQNVKIEFAPAHPSYANPLSHRQMTGQSRTIVAFWEPLRQAGAATRELLINAAAQTWQVEKDQCHALNGSVVHFPTQHTLRYGDLVALASQLPIPSNVPLKSPAQFRLIGKPTQRLDSKAKVTGLAVFGQDVNVPNALVAVIARNPVFGSHPHQVKSFDSSASSKIKGVKQVVAIESGIAVVADNFWSALKGSEVLRVIWTEGAADSLDTRQIRALFAAAVDNGKIAEEVGDVTQAFLNAKRTVTAEYEAPYLAHACMEPMNCTADVREDGCDVWVPTQGVGGVQRTVEKLTGLSADKIRVHATFLGGGFGRRSEQDFVVEAVLVSKAVHAPVKVMWTREDDIQHDYYRPASFHKMRAALDESSNPIAWEHRLSSSSILKRLAPFFGADSVDPTATEGATDLPYSIPHRRVTAALIEPGVPVGFWRSVGHSQNAFVKESFIDEIAYAVKKDPFEFRRQLLDNQPRLKAVLEAAAKLANWTSPLSSGRFRGIAVVKSFSTYVAQVAEVSISKEREIIVHRVFCAVDCGLIVNPSTVISQMHSGILFGLTAALKGEITIEKGGVQQSNFHDYPILRMNEAPQIEVALIKSAEPPTGIGETAVPPIAPAVANAVFAATAVRLRRLPLRLASTVA